MAWMPVAEAAVTLGVSERTIWRRIKSETIESRSENGRTLVVLDTLQPAGDAARRFSCVGAAQLSVRDPNALSEVLAALDECRTVFDVEMARARRTTRWAQVTAATLLLGLGAGIWYHDRQIADLQRGHAADLVDSTRRHEGAVAELQARSARAEGLSQARADELDDLRSIGSEQRMQLAAVEASREALQRTLETELTGLHSTLTAQHADEKARDTVLARLQEKIVQLQSELRDNERVYQAMRRQSDRVTEAIRRSAARSIGLAEGLRLNLAHHQLAARRMQRELSAYRLAAAPSADGASQHDPVQWRQSIWASLVNDGVPAVGAGAEDESPPASWISLLKTWFHTWFNGQPDNGDPDRFASAD